ncbi:MAG: hypothetical protein ACRDRR_05760, partial [Pseudonocardiaceae bacterium]
GGQVDDKARHRGQSSREPHRVTNTKPDGPPPRSTATTLTEFTAKVHALNGPTQPGYTTRQGAYDLRKLRGKQLVIKPDRTRRYQTPAHTASTIAALLTLRDQVSPILAGVRSPRLGRKPATWTAIDRDYERLRINMQTLFHDLGITTTTGAAAA